MVSGDGRLGCFISGPTGLLGLLCGLAQASWCQIVLESGTGTVDVSVRDQAASQIFFVDLLIWIRMGKGIISRVAANGHGSLCGVFCCC